MNRLTGKIDRARGFSLIELMVAMVIGLLILAAVSTILVNSKKNYTTQDSLARLQENARFTIQFLTRDIRMAGYYGCGHDITKIATHLNSGSGFSFDFNNPLIGFDNINTAWYPAGTSPVLNPPMAPNTDAIAIRLLDTSSQIQLTSSMPQASSDLKLSSIAGLNVGDILMLTDCSGADLFQITNMNSSNLNVVHNTGTGTPGNAGKMSKPYSPPASVMKFNTLVYYIGISPTTSSLTLYRQLLVTDPTSNIPAPQSQELVEGIENLQILYGKDTTGDRVADIYLKAGDVGLQSAVDWGNVVAVRIGILASTLANSSVPGGNDKQFGTEVDTKSYTVNGYPVPAANDRRQRRVFTTTIIPRNLQ